MYIKNKFLRFISSVFITLLLYFLFALNFGDNVIETMFIFAVFGIFFVVPFLIFMVYTFYVLLTRKSERSKRASIIFKVMITFLIIMALLYVVAQFTDLLDNLF